MTTLPGTTRPNDTPDSGPSGLDVTACRADFPILGRAIGNHPLVYLDNAATTQKPVAVLDALDRYYRTQNANVHRGVHQLSQDATAAYEDSRLKVQRFLNASDAREIVFVRGATEAINLVAHSFGRPRLAPGDAVLVSAMEHHSNIVPWQLLCQQTGAQLRVIPMNDQGELLLDDYEKLLDDKVKLVALVHVSNALGTINPIKSMIAAAHARGIPVLIDGAQAVPHVKVDVRDLDCDFYVFSGHKLFGPTGIGALYGKLPHLEAMPPYQSGGDMIKYVSFQRTVYNDVPYKFEAGTPDIAGAIGLAAAIDYVSTVGLDAIAAWEHQLLLHGTAALAQIPGLRLIGTARDKAAVLSFVLDGVHPHDIGTILDHRGIAIRTGHHCAQPVMERFGVPATARASLAFYNTPAELDALAAGLLHVLEVFK